MLTSMKKPDLKYLISTQLDEGKLPEKPEDCSIHIEANIGIEGEDASDIFSFNVVTIKFLERDDKPRWGRGYLIVERFSWDIVENSVNKLLRHCQGDNWEEIAKEINKEMHWEYDKYIEHEG